MPEQKPEVRARNFQEVTLGYSKAMAMEEASRCLNCKNKPCVSGCPVGVRIPEFIACVAAGDFDKAYDIITSTNGLPAVCGRVCPQEHQCEGKCVRGIKGEPVGIGRLERFVADYKMEQGNTKVEVPASNGHKVAVVGAGPSGLTCAGDLARLGYQVTVFEAFHVAGGVLMYGIPEFRLPKAIVQKEIKTLKALGVNIMTDMVIGKVLSVDELLEDGYEAIFIGSGAGLPRFMGIEGEALVGVCSANEYLTRVNLGRAYDFPNFDTPTYPGKHVTVFGAGNVAMDAARTALRLGAESSTIIYRRSRAEMPARREEIEHAEEEGVKLFELVGPLHFNAGESGVLKSVTLQRMALGEPDASGRRRPVPIEGEVFEHETDLAVVAVGTRSNPILLEATPGLELNKRGYIIVNEETGETSIPNVFAGGDIVTGAATVILAMGAGRKAAQEIAKRLLG